MIPTLADETELWFVPEGYADENLPEIGVFEVVQGWVRAAIRGRKLSAADLAIRKLGRFWQTGTGESCGPKGTDYAINHAPETGITTVTVGGGGVACVMPGGDERVIGLLERMELGPDGAGSVFSLADLPEWARDQLVTVGAAADCQDPRSRVSDGDPMVLVDGLSVARVGDSIDDGGTLSDGPATIFVNGQPAAVVAVC